MPLKKHIKKRKISHKLILVLLLFIIVAVAVISIIKSRFVDVVYAKDYNVIDYVALGDSITLGAAVGSNGYVPLYKNFISNDLAINVRLTNLGIDSLNSTQLLDKLNTDSNFIQKVSNAEIISLMIGANDFWQPRIDYFSNNCGGPDNQDCLRNMVKTFDSNFNQILSRINLLNDSSILTLRVGDIYYYFISGDYQSGQGPVLNSYLTQMNDYIHSLAISNGYEIANVHTAYNGESGLEDPEQKGYIGPDKIHPTILGHQVIADLFRATQYSPASSDNDSDNIINIKDNCPSQANPNQENLNGEIVEVLVDGKPFQDATYHLGDFEGDACDSDIDGDGLLNKEETNLGTNLYSKDTDNDRIVDRAEFLCGSDPLNAQSIPTGTDSDNDRLPDSCETSNTFGTNPNSNDSDGDTIRDGAEALNLGTDPTKNDSDNDGCSDKIEVSTVNGDRAVTVIDMYLIAQRFGKTVQNDPNMRVFDVDGDGTITIYDVYFARNNFGGNCMN